MTSNAEARRRYSELEEQTTQPLAQQISKYCYSMPFSSRLNTAKFKTLWRTKFAVLMARERGRIGSDAALGDMPKRLQAHSYDEMNEGPAR